MADKAAGPCPHPILVVGAGVSGLQAARALLRRGLQVVVLEQSEDVGGVWIRNYQGYGLQVPWELYQFPEFPYPHKAELKEYPAGDAVREYVRAYARHFGLYRHILFSCRLISLRRIDPGADSADSGHDLAGDGLSHYAARPAEAERNGGCNSGSSARRVPPQQSAQPPPTRLQEPAGAVALPPGFLLASTSRLRRMLRLSFGSISQTTGSRGGVRASGEGAAASGRASGEHAIAAAHGSAGSGSTVSGARGLAAAAAGPQPRPAAEQETGGAEASSPACTGTGMGTASTTYSGIPYHGGTRSGMGSAAGTNASPTHSSTSLACACPTGAPEAQHSAPPAPPQSAPLREPRPPSKSQAPLVPPSARPPPPASASAAANGHSAARGPSRAPKGAGPAAAAQPRGLLDGGGWEAVYEDSSTGRQYTLRVSYVVLCTGLYATPFIPTIPGQALYRGLQVHSRDFTDAGVAAGKRVLVVGAGKTAADIVTELTATKTAAAVTLLYRRPHWPLPRFIGPVSLKLLAYTRLLSACLLPAYYDASPGDRAAAAVLTPLRKAFWIRFMARVNSALAVKETLGRPDRPICQDIWYSGQVVDAARWPEVIHNPKVEAIQGEVEHFTPVSAVLRDGTELQPDIVLYATGYSNLYLFLEPAAREALEVQHDGLYLYRHVLAPRLPGLAFVGAEVSTFNNILTAALQAEWLASALVGGVALPPPAAMAADVAAQRRWRRAVMPPHKLRGSSVMLYMQCYHDQLLRDMGLPTHRKARSWRHPLAECVEPYTAQDYEDLYAASAAAAAAAVSASANGQRVSQVQLQADAEAELASFSDAAEAAAADARMEPYRPAPVSGAKAYVGAPCGLSGSTVPYPAGWPGTSSSAAAGTVGSGAMGRHSPENSPCGASQAPHPTALQLGAQGSSNAASEPVSRTVRRQQVPSGLAAPLTMADLARVGPIGVQGAALATHVGSHEQPSPSTRQQLPKPASPLGGPHNNAPTAAAGAGAWAQEALPGTALQPCLSATASAAAAHAAGACIPRAAFLTSSVHRTRSPEIAASGGSHSPMPPALLGQASGNGGAGYTPAAGAAPGPNGSPFNGSPPTRPYRGLSGLASEGAEGDGEFDEQDTLYSLDALPLALQAFRGRTRVRAPSDAAAGSADQGRDEPTAPATAPCGSPFDAASAVADQTPGCAAAAFVAGAVKAAAAAGAAGAQGRAGECVYAAWTESIAAGGGGGQGCTVSAWGSQLDKSGGSNAAGGGWDSGTGTSSGQGALAAAGGGGGGGNALPPVGTTASGAMRSGASDGLVLSRVSGSDAGFTGSDAGGSVASGKDKRRRPAKRRFSLVTLLMRRRPDGDVYDISSSRIEPSSAAVAELAYKVLPPRHVEEAMAAAAAASPAAAAAASRPAAAHGRDAVRHASASRRRPPAAPRASLSSAASPPPAQGSTGGTSLFSDEALLLPPPRGVAIGEHGGGGGNPQATVARGEHSFSASSGVSYTPSCSTVAPPLPWADPAAAAAILAAAGVPHSLSDDAGSETSYMRQLRAAADALAAGGAGGGRAAAGGGRRARQQRSSDGGVESPPYTDVDASRGPSSSGVSYTPSCSTVAPPFVQQRWQ